MSAMAYRTGLILCHAGTGGMDCFFFCTVTQEINNVHSAKELHAIWIYSLNFNTFIVAIYSHEVCTGG